MTSTQLPDQGLVFWPVGTGDSTTIVIDDDHVVQVDIHDLAMAGEDDAVVAAVVDRLVEVLPTRDDQPYLAGFVLTHADKDHCLGFADLLDRVMIGEIWATPRLWREYTDNDIVLCEDAEAFHEEVLRRVDATLAAVAAGREPESGDRIRVIGYDTDQSTFSYHDLPEKYLSHPGDAILTVDGEDLSDRFEAFVHAPFKDDCASERNDTSLALQVTLKDGDRQAHALLLGDLGYETIKKIFEYSEYAERPERLMWEVLHAPHHCSKKVMYPVENGEEVLKQDILDLLERHAADDAVVVVSSNEFPMSNKSGDNPPHLIALDRYEEIADEVVCAGEYPDSSAPRPVVFGVDDAGFVLPKLEDDGSSESVEKSGARTLMLAGGSVLAALAATRVARHLTRPRPAVPGGLGAVREAVATVRGDNAAPQQAVGFGRR